MPGERWAGIQNLSIRLLEFRANCEKQLVLNESDLILHECTEKLQITACRQKGNGLGIIDFVAHESITRTPDQFVTLV